MLHQIGVGALGPVFRTYEPERDRLVAVKVFRLDITPEVAQQLADELSRSAEAGLFHPSIVEPIAAGVQGTVAYCAEEYVAAESLDTAMRHYAPAPIGTVLPFITQLAGAIDFARAAGVGHGALHPRDIFVSPEEVRATGFGVVEALERVGLRAPVRRPYSPPERIAGQAWDTRADVFSLAAITFELLTGRRPAGVGNEIGTLTAGTPNSWMDALHAVLARAMDPDAGSRYPTALAFASALEAAGRGQSVTESSRSFAPAAAVIPDPTEERISGPADQRPRARTDARTSGPAEEPDIDAERDEDEADHLLRLEEAAIAAASSEAFTDVDDDIAAEAEADRFAADDFLLDAAGAASGAPEPPALDGVRAGHRPFDSRALEDDEMMADEPPSPTDEPRDLLHDTRADARPPLVTPPSMGYAPIPQESSSETRSLWPIAVLVILALAGGAAGGWFLRGRVEPPAGEATQATATTGSTAAGNAPAGREFSEQAVAPPQASSPAPVSPAPQTANRATPAPAARPPAEAPKAPATGTLIVRSTPAGAGVTLNGQWRGRTPLTIEDLALRRYDVRVVQQGYEPATQAVSLTNDTPERSLSLRLERQQRAAAPRPTPAPAPPASRQQDSVITSNYSGSIYVDSRPRGAKVSIDGKAVGVTPLRVADVRIGSHVVRLELPDHRIWSSTATVAAGQESRVTGSLERIQ